jgi:hypothetical protein
MYFSATCHAFFPPLDLAGACLATCSENGGKKDMAGSQVSFFPPYLSSRDIFLRRRFTLSRQNIFLPAISFFPVSSRHIFLPAASFLSSVWRIQPPPPTPPIASITTAAAYPMAMAMAIAAGHPSPKADAAEAKFIVGE